MNAALRDNAELVSIGAPGCENGQNTESPIRNFGQQRVTPFHFILQSEIPIHEVNRRIRAFNGGFSPLFVLLV